MEGKTKSPTQTGNLSKWQTELANEMSLAKASSISFHFGTYDRLNANET